MIIWPGELAVAIAAALENRGWLERGEGKRPRVRKRGRAKVVCPPGSQFPKQRNLVDTAWPDNVSIGRSVGHTWLDLSARNYSNVGVNAAGSNATIDHPRLVKVTALGRHSLHQELGLTFCDGLTVALSQRISPPAFCLPQRREGLPTSECRRDLPDQTAPWPPAGRRSRHLASHVCSETHSRSRFPLR